VAVVALSRLVLGVHYLIDVVAGVALGAVALGALYWLSEYGAAPGRVLLAGAAIGGVGLVQGATFEGVAVTGGAVGGWLVWRGVADATPPRPANGRAVVAGAVVLAVAGGLFGLVYTFAPSHPSAFLGAAVAVGGAVGAPALGERVSG